MDAALNIGLNVLSNFITALIAGAGAWFVVDRRRRRLSRFFGMRNAREILLYLSSISVVPMGTRATGEIREGFYGQAIDPVEYRAALTFTSGLAGRASAFTSAIFGAATSINEASSRINLSPDYSSMPLKTTDDGLGVTLDYSQEASSHEVILGPLGQAPCVVVAGSPQYNLLTHYIMNGPSATKSRFSYHTRKNENQRVEGFALGTTPDPEHSWMSSETDTERIEYFLIERLLHGRTTVLICAGTSSTATAAALYSLTDWQRMERQHKAGPFAEVHQLKVPKTPGQPKSLDYDPRAMPSKRIAIDHLA